MFQRQTCLKDLQGAPDVEPLEKALKAKEPKRNRKKLWSRTENKTTMRLLSPSSIKRQKNWTISLIKTNNSLLRTEGCKVNLRLS